MESLAAALRRMGLTDVASGIMGEPSYKKFKQANWVYRYTINAHASYTLYVPLPFYHSRGVSILYNEKNDSIAGTSNVHYSYDLLYCHHKGICNDRSKMWYSYTLISNNVSTL